MNESGDPNVQRIREKMNVFPVHQDALFTSDKINGRSLRFFPMICSEGAQALQSVEKIGSAISEADKVVIGLTDVYDPDMMLMSYDASNGITIPIGLEGAHARVELKLGGVSDGGKAHTYHAMLGGTIGSGKTAMLHNIIMGTLMCYNPNEVQVYLIDMKDGVEFKRYAPFMELANLRIVAIDAEKEFGLAVLKELTREQGLRAQKFKETATSRIEAYNEKMRREGRMNDIMPRLVVVMDEIQWLFDKEEDPIVKECVNCMRTLILQGGSAFGIQMILATQDWANVKGLDEGLYNNIGVRIALKNTKESAQTILRSDNDITDRLAVFDAGQAVFNEYAGHRDYNHEFRGIWVPREEAEDILTRLLEAQKMNPYLRKPAFQRLLSADVADNDKNTLNIFAKTGVVQPDHSMSYRMMVGEGLTIRNNYHPTIKTDRGQNMLLVGSSETIASRLAGFAAISAIYETIRLEERITSPVITVFDFIGEQIGEEGMNLLPGLMERLPEVFRVFRSSELNDGLQILENEMNSATDSAQHFVIFFGLNRARRLNDTSAYAESPRDRLVRLVQEGPAKGINFIVWANAPGVYQQMYGDILGCFEHRLVFDNTDEDLYPYYVQDKKPEQADKRNALSFNLDGDNMLIKLYSLPSSTWLDQFVASVRKYLG